MAWPGLAVRAAAAAAATTAPSPMAFLRVVSMKSLPKVVFLFILRCTAQVRIGRFAAARLFRCD
jgi:hypothetical protein